MVPPASKTDVDLGKRLATETGPVALEWFSAVDLGTRTKADGSPVTQGDLAVEKKLREILAEADPEASILGEEEGLSEGDSGRRWFLDPIDGTTSFVHGVPLWGTLIALHDEHGPAVGVISLPAMNELIIGARGRGCTFNDKPCSVSKQQTLKNAVVTTWGYEYWPVALFEDLQSRKPKMRGWSDAYGWGLLATGRADVVIDFHLNPWDVAPMQVILPEAGGRFSAFDGSDAIDKPSAIGTNGVLHEDVLQMVKAFT